MWTHLERQKGVLDYADQGETQLEMDRRRIQDLIRTLKQVGTGSNAPSGTAKDSVDTVGHWSLWLGIPMRKSTFSISYRCLDLYAGSTLRHA